jgi:hypothetical protein
METEIFVTESSALAGEIQNLPEPSFHSAFDLGDDFAEGRLICHFGQGD